MELLKLVAVLCPYCAETIDISVDCSVEFQQYVEDCQVCCRPIVLAVNADEQQNVTVSARHENE